jgi:hypothetical protein
MRSFQIIKTVEIYLDDLKPGIQTLLGIELDWLSLGVYFHPALRAVLTLIFHGLLFNFGASEAVLKILI